MGFNLTAAFVKLEDLGKSLRSVCSGLSALFDTCLRKIDYEIPDETPANEIVVIGNGAWVGTSTEGIPIRLM